MPTPPASLGRSLQVPGIHGVDHFGTHMTTAAQSAEDALKGIAIPPRPSVLVEIGQELRRSEPNLKKVAAQIARDVGLSSGVL